jgi:large subunit ribosomal protein L5
MDKAMNRKVENRVEKRYKDEVVTKLKQEFGYKNVMQVPKLKKIVLSAGVGETTQNIKVMDYAVYAMTQISGQKPLVIKSKKAIATFKLRENLPIGCKVTLRRQRMYEFLDRLITVALPRVRDFKGVPKKGFDGRGNYNMGIKEQIVFPEVVLDKLDKVRGMDITFVTDAKTDDEARSLLEHIGLPFRK